MGTEPIQAKIGGDTTTRRITIMIMTSDPGARGGASGNAAERGGDAHSGTSPIVVEQPPLAKRVGEAHRAPKVVEAEAAEEIDAPTLSVEKDGP